MNTRIENWIIFFFWALLPILVYFFRLSKAKIKTKRNIAVLIRGIITFFLVLLSVYLCASAYIRTEIIFFCHEGHFCDYAHELDNFPDFVKMVYIDPMPFWWRIILWISDWFWIILYFLVPYYCWIQLSKLFNIKELET